ncbi:ribosome biogenesis GTPase YlqF [Clostridium sp. DL1XJH146]
MAINWYPGHMVKTKRKIQDNLKLVDAVIEIRDARIVKSSSNPDINEICSSIPRIILLNKSDLSDEKVTNQWISTLTSETVKVIKGNSISGKGLKTIKPSIDSLLKEKYEKLNRRGIINYTARVMIVGVPNVGKSSFINRVAKASKAKVGNKPGVTRNLQWVKTNIGIELLDTPGVLWPKFDDETVGLNLAFTGAIKDEIMDMETLSLKLVEYMQEQYPDKLMDRYKLNELFDNPLDNLDNIARKRGAIQSGNNIDYNRISNIIMDDFRKGSLGKISLERP